MITMFQVVSAAVESQGVQAVFAEHRIGPDLRCVACARMGNARVWPCMHVDAARVSRELCQRKIADIDAQVNARM